MFSAGLAFVLPVPAPLLTLRPLRIELADVPPTTPADLLPALPGFGVVTVLPEFNPLPALSPLRMLLADELALPPWDALPIPPGPGVWVAPLGLEPPPPGLAGVVTPGLTTSVGRDGAIEDTVGRTTAGPAEADIPRGGMDTARPVVNTVTDLCPEATAV